MARQPSNQLQPDWRSQRGGSLLAVMVLLVVIGLVVVLMSGVTRNQAQFLDQNIAKDTWNLTLSSAASTVVALLSVPSDDCGQPGGICPALLPDPLDCGKVRFRPTLTSTRWRFLPSASRSGYVKVQESNGAVQDLTGHTRENGVLGSVIVDTFRTSTDDRDISKLMGGKPAAAVKVGEVEAILDGYACDPSGLITAVFVHLIARDKTGNRQGAINIRVPLGLPPPKCFVVPEPLADPAAASVKVIVLATGPWDGMAVPVMAGKPQVWRDNHAAVRRLRDADIVWEGRLPVAEAGVCAQRHGVTAAVRRGVLVASCEGHVWIGRDCTSSVAATTAASQVSVVKPVSIPSQASRVLPSSAKQLVRPPLGPSRRCPDGYFVKSGGVQYKMLYAEVNGECVAVRGRLP